MGEEAGMENRVGMEEGGKEREERRGREGGEGREVVRGSYVGSDRWKV